MTVDLTGQLPGYVLRAIECASEDDRVWFEEHPTRNWRLRDMRRFEFVDEDDVMPEGWTQRVVVIQHAPGYRQRWACIIVEDIANSGEAGEPSEATIRKWFRRHASSEEQQLAVEWRRLARERSPEKIAI